MPEPTGSGDKWPKEFLVRLSGCKKKRLCVSAEQIWRRLVALRRASEKVNIVDGKRGKRALVERTINFSDKMWRGTKVLANMLELCKRKGSLSCWTFYWFLRRRYSLFNSVLFIFSDFSVLLTSNDCSQSTKWENVKLLIEYKNIIIVSIWYLFYIFNKYYFNDFNIAIHFAKISEFLNKRICLSCCLLYANIRGQNY